MNFYITDDDETVRSILAQIIEDESLGQVVGESDDGASLDGETLNLNKVDILLIDLLMPNRDGLETIQTIKPTFKGKIIMISQIESKELISEAYLLEVEHYIIKPINKIEVLAVIQKVMKHTSLEKSISDIQKSLNNVLQMDTGLNQKKTSFNEYNIKYYGEFLISELGISGENGSKDLMEILVFLFNYEKKYTFEHGFPSLNNIYDYLANKKLGAAADEADARREAKASKQRVRRTVYQSLTHLASLGLTDFSNIKFEKYASHFFDFTIVRKKMTELKNESKPLYTSTRINIKKFIQALYFEAKRMMLE
ncbi:response regulator [Alteribacillus bidgolensis]|uniref:Two-component system, response regulator YcbB n=1 Tax=Alteribacillus bidgolensis TaxID=930129 RepID=A0A1G8HED2_9BACI|nr:response regulator [Alteribacillus bidgolensis]SDI04881.1 two-component system, response regulator YcbB [Alteribacillus bidgolensis]